MQAASSFHQYNTILTIWESEGALHNDHLALFFFKKCISQFHKEKKTNCDESLDCLYLAYLFFYAAFKLIYSITLK